MPLTICLLRAATPLVWNPAEGITVSGTTATIAAATGKPGRHGCLCGQCPGWFFTHTEQATIEKDRDYTFIAAMKQQVRVADACRRTDG